MIFFGVLWLDTLKGTFYRGQGVKSFQSPCVLFVHGREKDSSVPHWDSLAKLLQKKGYTVLSFDLRGHGKSTTIKDSKLFWREDYFPINRECARKDLLEAKELPDQIRIQEFNEKRYFTWMLNDLAAARRFLDLKNDDSECNISETYLVAEEEGATLAFLWLMVETWRDSVVPPLYHFPFPRWKGIDDVSGCVWLSIQAESLKHPDELAYFRNDLRWKSESMETTIQCLKRVPMLFVYGDADPKPGSDAKFIADKLLAPDKTIQETPQETVPLKSRLQGAELLQDNEANLETKVFQFIEKVHQQNTRKGRWMHRGLADADLYPVFWGVSP